VIFSVSVLTGNILNEDILGSMEFACKKAGSKLIVVLGHTNCGAILGACEGVEFGHLTGLLDKIKPAIELEKSKAQNQSDNEKEFIRNVTINNVIHSIEEIKKQSSILREFEKNGEIMIPADCMMWRQVR
jgi:carbonic anhydrase